MTLVTEQVSVNESERIWLRSREIELDYKNVDHVYDSTDKNSDTLDQLNEAPGSVDTITTQLKSTEPVSTVMWFFQNRKFKKVQISTMTQMIIFF